MKREFSIKGRLICQYFFSVLLMFLVLNHLFTKLITYSPIILKLMYIHIVLFQFFYQDLCQVFARKKELFVISIFLFLEEMSKIDMINF